MKPFPAPTRLHHGFTLMELLVVTAIIAALSALAFGAFNAATTHARKAAEIAAAKSLISAYLLYPSDNNGELMVAHYEGSSPDLDARDYTLPDGTTLGSAELHRYPFRLAPYMQDKIEGTLLVNRNKDQIAEAFPGSQFHYGTSLCPALGINYYYVGGYKADNEIAGATDCATNLMQVSKPGSLLVFASAFTEIGDKRIEGRYGVEPPYFRSKLWDGSLHVDARYGGKAVTAFMDGSVRLMTIDELRDMRYWSVRAAEADNANYTVAPVASTGVGGGNTGGGRGGRR
ncbi:prepilin-type N-terminal cleavage/methylation domain-containing protein [Verrucomicrobium sp. BvORR106]|uniref:prepilin-type N-terminal cleavage/methylation domain-containing protein n=1 Tax=Verrucomicrobium sp. BvORR106 TaxID=1403819 RepID=UPI0005715DF5|nr:prepilin-type N-terminal cleavage/methylation domain-containing protein [Verrucomicrobium sp. BvORR106]